MSSSSSIFDRSFIAGSIRPALRTLRDTLQLPVDIELSVHIRDPITGEVFTCGQYFNEMRTASRVTDELRENASRSESCASLSIADGVNLHGNQNGNVGFGTDVSVGGVREHVPSGFDSRENAIVRQDTVSSAPSVPVVATSAALQSIVTTTPQPRMGVPMPPVSLPHYVGNNHFDACYPTHMIGGGYTESFPVQGIPVSTPASSGSIPPYPGYAYSVDSSYPTTTSGNTPTPQSSYESIPMIASNRMKMISIPSISLSVVVNSHPNVICPQLGNVVFRKSVKHYMYSRNLYVPQDKKNCINPWSDTVERCLQSLVGPVSNGYNFCVVRVFEAGRFVNPEPPAFSTLVPESPCLYYVQSGSDNLQLDVGNKKYSFALDAGDLVVFPPNFAIENRIGSSSTGYPSPRVTIQFFAVNNFKTSDPQQSPTEKRRTTRPMLNKEFVKEVFNAVGSQIYAMIDINRKRTLLDELNAHCPSLHFFLDNDGQIRNAKEKVHAARLRHYVLSFRLFTNTELVQILDKYRKTVVSPPPKQSPPVSRGKDHFYDRPVEQIEQDLRNSKFVFSEKIVSWADEEEKHARIADEYHNASMAAKNKDTVSDSVNTQASTSSFEDVSEVTIEDSISPEMCSTLSHIVGSTLCTQFDKTESQ